MALDWIPISTPPSRRSRGRDIPRSGLVEPLYPFPVDRTGSRGKPLLRRSPMPLLPGDSDQKPDPEARRAGRNWELLVKVFNSLLRFGSVYQDEDNREIWKIAASDFNLGGLTGTFGEDGSISGLTGTFDSGSFGTG